MCSAVHVVSLALIRVEFSKIGLADTRALLHFYQAFWDGLVTCKRRFGLLIWKQELWTCFCSISGVFLSV